MKRILCGIAVVVFVSTSQAGTRVILISVDGLRPDAATPDAAPNISALRAAGASAARANNDLPSVTLPNHTSMLTGVPTEVHGVIENTTIPGTVRTPTVFHYAHAAGLRCAFFATKEKLVYLAPADDVETTFIDADLAKVTDALLEQLGANGPDLIFLHLREPDSTGHADGWMTPTYLEAVGRSDEQIGRIRKAVESQLPSGSNADRPTYMLVTADHGGTGLNHFENIETNRTIPWIVAGPGIAAGRVLDGAVTTLDTTPTVLWLLGVPKPESLTGAAQTEIAGAGSELAGQVEAPTADGPRVTHVAVVPPVGNTCFLIMAPAWMAGACAVAATRRNRR